MNVFNTLRGWLNSITQQNVNDTVNDSDSVAENVDGNTAKNGNKKVDAKVDGNSAKKVDAPQKTGGETSKVVKTTADAGVSEDTTSTTPDTKQNEVIAWLASRGISVSNHAEESEANRALDRIANYMGMHYGEICALYKALKWGAAQNRPVQISLQDASQAEINACTHICLQLHNCAYLTRYFYKKETRTIYLTIASEGKIRNFFTGDWYERYIKTQIRTILNRNNIRYDMLANAQIRFSNGDGYELDIMFLLGDKPVWVECKTGSFQDAMNRIMLKQNLLGVPRNQTILTILDMPEDSATIATQTHGILVTDHCHLKECLEKILGTALS